MRVYCSGGPTTGIRIRLWLNDNVGAADHRKVMGWWRGQGWQIARMSTERGVEWAVDIDNEELALVFTLRWS